LKKNNGNAVRFERMIRLQIVQN